MIGVSYSDWNSKVRSMNQFFDCNKMKVSEANASHEKGRSNVTGHLEVWFSDSSLFWLAG